MAPSSTARAFRRTLYAASLAAVLLPAAAYLVAAVLLRLSDWDGSALSSLASAASGLLHGVALTPPDQRAGVAEGALEGGGGPPGCARLVALALGAGSDEAAVHLAPGVHPATVVRERDALWAASPDASVAGAFLDDCGAARAWRLASVVFAVSALVSLAIALLHRAALSRLHPALRLLGAVASASTALSVAGTVKEGLESEFEEVTPENGVVRAVRALDLLVRASRMGRNAVKRMLIEAGRSNEAETGILELYGAGQWDASTHLVTAGPRADVSVAGKRRPGVSNGVWSSRRPSLPGNGVGESVR